MLNPVRRTSSLILAALTLGLAFACGSTGTTPGPGDPSCPLVDLDGGGGVEKPPDGASLCAAGPCNYQTQVSCMDNGTACRPQVPAGATTVFPGCEPAGEGVANEACKVSADCAIGYMCVQETTTVSKCRKMCCGGDWSACDSGESCIRQLAVKLADATVVSAVDLCFPVGTCDVFDPTSCANEPGRECKIVDPTGAVACAPKSTAKLGDPCGPPNVCAQGFTCVGSITRTCRRLCRAVLCGEPACPAEEGTCVHFDRNPPGVGECTTTGT